VAADRAARGWAHQLRGEATVQVRPDAGETGSEAAARAAETLAGVKGVSEAAALEREKAEELLKPWLGQAALKDLPIPHLVTVELDPRHPASIEDLRRALRVAGVDAEVDDHGRWLEDVERSAQAIRFMVAGLFLLTAAAAGAVIAFATRVGMAARRDVVEVLHFSGAKDEYVAGLFQSRFAKLSAVSGLWGAAAAALAAGLLKAFGGGEGFAPALPLVWTDLLLVSPCPLVAATVAALAARSTTLRLLRGMV
jgi:cell division transport system permease protein